MTRFIVFEGIDGSGKTTQAGLLAWDLRQDGHDVLATREPGGTNGAEAVRGVILHPPRGTDWSSHSETLLFAAARRDHYEKMIKPKLDEGGIVVCDRFIDSTRVYQAHGAGRAMIDSIHAMTIGLEPDLTILVDIDPATSMARTGSRADGGNAKDGDIDLQERCRQGFLDLAREFPARFRVIDGERSIDAVSKDVIAAVKERLG